MEEEKVQKMVKALEAVAVVEVVVFLEVEW